MTRIKEVAQADRERISGDEAAEMGVVKTGVLGRMLGDGAATGY